MNIAFGTGRLAGRVALVTGSAQGIGAILAAGLAHEGAKLALCDVNDPAPTALALQQAGVEVVSGRLDVTDGEAVQHFVRQVEARLGAVDVLVNNAAIFAGLERQPFSEISAETWDRVMAVNVRGVLECAKAVVPGMKARGCGRIINIASATVHAGAPMMMHYVASKGAVIAMTRAMARELGDHGISVNALAPGLTMSDSARRDYADSPATQRAVERRCFKREQLPQDLVGPLIYFASDDSGFVTGQTHVVDGGAMMP